MKRMLPLLFLLTSIYASAQKSSFTGEYKFGTDPELGRTGIAYIYPETDSTFLIYIELSKGAPSYNSGALLGQIQLITSDHARLTRVEETSGLNCSFDLTLNNDMLVISTQEDYQECGFGYGVIADGEYQKYSNKSPRFFIDRIGNKTYFKNVNWKEWSE